MRVQDKIILSRFEKNTKSTQLDEITYGIENLLFHFGFELNNDTQ